MSTDDKPSEFDAAPAAAKVGPRVRLDLRKPRELSGEAGGTIELTDFVVEEIAESPDLPESYPAGSGVVISVEIDGSTVELSELSAGYESKSAVWTEGYRLTLLALDDRESSAELLVERVTDETAEILHEEAKIMRGGSLALSSGLELVFEGHGHKRVHAGQQSPLIVGVHYRTANRRLDTGSYSLYPPDENRWRFQNYEFRLKSAEYDESMVLGVRRLALEALTVE